MKPRPTLKDIASECGVHHATVSRALRNSPSISEKTRKVVKEAAEKLEYQADPFLSALANRKQRGKGGAISANLAWVTNFDTREGWKEYVHNLGYFYGCFERAQKIGCNLDVIWAGDRKQNGIENLLKARGVRGVILAPQPLGSSELEINPELFHAVTLGMSVLRDDVTRICHDHYHSVASLVKKLAAKGFRKPKFYACKDIDARVDLMMSHGFRYGVECTGLDVSPVPRYVSMDITSDDLAQYITEDRPDVAIIHYRNWHLLEDALKRINLTIPDDVSVAVITTPKKNENIGGVLENADLMGSLAVDSLVRLISNGRHDSDAKPHRIVIDGTIMLGKTIGSPTVTPGEHCST